MNDSTVKALLDNLVEKFKCIAECTANGHVQWACYNGIEACGWFGQEPLIPVSYIIQEVKSCLEEISFHTEDQFALDLMQDALDNIALYEKSQTRDHHDQHTNGKSVSPETPYREQDKSCHDGKTSTD